MGYDITKYLRANPEITQMYETYLLCRAVSLVFVETTKGEGKGAKTFNVPVYWPSSLAQLPNSGGISNQSYYDMRIFGAFLRGERQGVLRKLSTRG